MIFEALMTGILAYQVLMPQVNNAKYALSITPDGTIVRMNTQDGSMERCDVNFQCSKVPQKESAKELDYKY